MAHSPAVKQSSPSLFARFAHALKAARMSFAGWGGQMGATGAPWGGAGFWPTYQPNSRFDWVAMAGDLWRNEVVSICLGWIADNYCQPEFQVTEEKGAVYEPIPDHPLVKLLAKPNRFYGPSAMWQAVITSEAVSGNAYLMKARPEAGWDQPMELWYLPHWQVFPQWGSDGRHFITHYLYRVPGKADQRLQVEDVVHFRRGLDLYNLRSGEAPLGPQLREVCSDTEASGYVAAILANSGVPNVAISAGAADVTIPEEEAEKLKRNFFEKFGGDNRGRALVCTRAMKVEPFQWSPEELALDKLPMRAERRLCAALRIPPILVGLSDAPSGFDNGGQYEAARRAGYEDCLMPMQARHCETLDAQLLPDFGDPETQCCHYDYENVRALAEDEDAKSARAVTQFQAGIITRAEARAKVGFESDKDDEVYFVPKGGELVPADMAGAPALAQQADQKQQAAAAGLQALQGAPVESQGDAQAHQQPATAGANGNGYGAAVGR